jgi:hypothetical protein
MSQIHEAQAIVAMAGSSVTDGDLSTDDARARISLALSGAEKLLDSAHDAVDAVCGALQDGAAPRGAEG